MHKKWDADFGGTDNEFFYGFDQMSDGGFVLVGSSASGIGGNKTQPSKGAEDFWIVKTDALGHRLWDKTYGGGGSDIATAVSATRDGGCIVGGFTGSDSSGDVSQHKRGGYDFWVVKLDAMGNKQWDRLFGGSGDETIYRIRQCPGGGYIMVGNSDSGVSGDRTQPSWGADDCWIVRIDSAGNKMWDKRFGTRWSDDPADIILTADGGYLIGATSSASDTSISGDKSQPNFGPHTSNFWIIKIDSVGSKIWDKTFGGTQGEGCVATILRHDGNYVLGGESNDFISGNKT